MILIAVLAAVGSVAGLGLAVAGARAMNRPESTARSDVAMRRARAIQALVALAIGSDEQTLRLVGMRPAAFAAQRFGGLFAGATMGGAISALGGNTPLTNLTVGAALGTVGWLAPMLGVRDSARRARAELDLVMRVWIALVAQQVTAGRDPAAAMLAAARAGQRPAWHLLHRFLLGAQQRQRPAWEGLAEIVERYGVHSLSPIVSALGLANQRGTRMAEAVLIAADTLWREAVAQERENAARRSQIIVVPATGVAFALAAILVYPPFTALTGGQVLVGP
ncbi:MAG: hypothetical protein OXJ90_22940 [Spirochaetaceae bacterium]|nr:hypothetical protein [Spirochaetaceae bacterium]